MRSCASEKPNGGQLAEDVRKQLIDRVQQDPSLAAKLVGSLDSEALNRIATESGNASTESGDAGRPSALQLRRHALRQAIPFMGFGFFDNLVMLTVGDAIDSTFGVALGFSTLAAAGMGQMVSDSVGISLQGFIERFADKLGLPDPRLSLEQERSNFCKNVTQMSRIVGIVFGCFLGMCPLLFLDTQRSKEVDALLEKLPASKRSAFWSALETVNFLEGETILEQGGTVEHLYLLKTGSVEVIGQDAHGNKVHACELGPGDVFGEIEFFSEKACIAHVVATTAVRAQRLSKKEFNRILGEEVAQQLFEEEIIYDPEDSRYTYFHMVEKSAKEQQEDYSRFS